MDSPKAAQGLLKLMPTSVSDQLRSITVKSSHEVAHERNYSVTPKHVAMLLAPSCTQALSLGHSIRF